MKAIFCDFYGTVVHEYGPKSYEVVKRVLANSNSSSPEEVLGYWWTEFRQRLSSACGKHWQSQSQLALDSFKALTAHFSCLEDPAVLRDMMEEHWCNPPMFEDTKDFLDALDLPLYFITNSDERYITTAVKYHGLNPAGIFTSEQAKYYKPKPEIFAYALDYLNLKPEEVLHIGDSLSGDIECPSSIGIRTLWMNRDNKEVPDGVTAVTNLSEAIAKINEFQK